MKTSTKSLRSAQRHLEAYEDWKADHDAAMECYEFESWIEEGVQVLGLLEEADRSVRVLVYRGLIPCEPQIGEALQALFQGWLRRAESGLPTLAKHQRAFGDVAGAEKLQKRIGHVREILAKWGPLVCSEMRAAQDWRVTPEEESELRSVLAAKPGEPGVLQRELRPMPTGDASLIR